MSEQPTWEKAKFQPYKELLEQLKNLRSLTLQERAKLEQELEQEVDDGPVDETE